MNQHELDKAIAVVKEDHASESEIRAAAGRVFRRVFDDTHLPQSVDHIRSCSDFQSLIPAYLADTLPPARALLLHDHASKCVVCRRALAAGRRGEPDVITADAASPRRAHLIPVRALPIAATLAVGVALGIAGARLGLLPGQSSVQATVSSVEGKLYRVTKVGSILMEAGSQIANADELRTAQGSRASLRLVNGGVVEIGERTDVSLSRGWEGTTVNLAQGRLIGRTTGERSGDFYVSSLGVVVPVRNALLAVNRGIKGSRVAVAEGSSEVLRGGATLRLVAGQQMTTDGLRVGPISAEFDWSKNADSYLALLGEFSKLQKSIQQIPSPELRYSTDLAKYVPDDAVLYAAIPNLGGTIAEAKRIFDERLTQSEVLRNWWNQQPASRTDQFDRLLNQLTSASQYLGTEIVFSLAPTAGEKNQSALVLADVRQAGLAEYLRQNIAPNAGVQIITSASQIPNSADHHPIVLVLDQILAASTDGAELRRAAQLIQGPAATSFTATPFYARLAKSYQAGIDYLFAIDLNQLNAKSVSTSKSEEVSALGNAQYLVFERRTVAGDTDTHASISFNGTRQGVASWVGAPGPVGSLEFVSPDATAAASFVMKSPRAIGEEFLAFAARSPGSAAKLSDFESRAGISVLDDFAATLGRDVTFAIDGPMLPVPSWRLIIEVDDPTRLQQTLTTLMDRFNQATTETHGGVQVGNEVVNSQTFYWLRSKESPATAVYYTFSDGYLLAASGEGDLLQAIQNRQTGHSLPNSQSFRAQLPSDTYTDFSGLVYVNGRSSLGAIAGQLNSSAALTEQQRSLLTFLAGVGPGAVCLYADPDRITAATRGSFLGFDLGTLLRFQQRRPPVALTASNAHMVKSSVPRRR